MSAAYSMHRGRAWLGFAICLGFGLICLGSTVSAPTYWIVSGSFFGASCLATAAYVMRWLLHKGPLLVISTEGIYYAPFADRAAPWNEITAMTRILAFSRSQFLNKVNWTRAPRNDQLNFDVVDLRHYPTGIFRAISRSGQRMIGVPPISLQLGMFDAEPDAIIAEIKKYWTGHIAQFDPRPVHQR